MKRTSSTTPPAATPTVRCAVYTRKSTEEGLEKEFNSLDAQREAGEAYVKSQAGVGWTLVPTRYDDGGFTGGNTERPGLRRLLADIEAGRLDAVVVYKVDRLSAITCGDSSIPSSITDKSSTSFPEHHGRGSRTVPEFPLPDWQHYW